LRDYFQLDVNLTKLYADWSERDAVFKKRAQSFMGIRILRQPPVENMITFICSSCNNIPRITSMVRIARCYALLTRFSKGSQAVQAVREAGGIVGGSRVLLVPADGESLRSQR